MSRHVDFTIETNIPAQFLRSPLDLGNVNRTRHKWAVCANTCQRAPISQFIARKIWLGLLEASMIVLA